LRGNVIIHQPLLRTLNQKQFIGGTTQVVLAFHLDELRIVVLVVFVVQAGIERLRPSCLLKILGKLPLLEDRLDLGNER